MNVRPASEPAARVERGRGLGVRGRRRRATALAALAACAVTVGASVETMAGAPSAPAHAAVREESPAWTELKPAQQAVLAPLRQEWSTLDLRSKRKWVELAGRFPTLSADEQRRVQARMTDWARMTPAQRGEARLHYQQARQMSPNERQARWDAYQALTDDEKRRLAARSSARAAAPADPARNGASAALHAGRDAPGGTGGPMLPAPAAAPRAVAPALVQAAPGATTTLIDRRPTPPEHQRPGVAHIRGSADPTVRVAPLVAPHRGSVDAASAPASGGRALPASGGPALPGAAASEPLRPSAGPASAAGLPVAPSPR